MAFQEGRELWPSNLLGGLPALPVPGFELPAPVVLHLHMGILMEIVPA